MLRVVPVVFALLLAAPAAARADIIVKREPGLSAADRADLRAGAGVKLVATLPLARTEVVEAAPGEQADALAALNADPDVVYAEPDRPVKALAANYFPSQWALSNTIFPGADISALSAWTLSEGADVTVGVVDTGVDLQHEDLAGQLVPGHDWVDGGEPDDENGHGTHVTGTIAALDDDMGVVGVAPEAKVMPLRVLGADGSGSMSAVAAAFAYAGDHGVRVVNASLGSEWDVQAVKDAIASHPGTLYVVAAGNSAANDDDPASAEYPCAYALANVLCVGASDKWDRPAGFSNYGATSVDLFAPGVSIASTYITDAECAGYCVLSGTSMASPHVAGAAALVLGARHDVSTAQLRQALLSTVDAKPVFAGKSVTGGRLNAAAAVGEIAGVTPEPLETPTPTPTPPAATPTPVAPDSTPAPVSTPTPVVAPAPTLSGLRLSGALKGRQGRLRVTFSLSGASTVRLSVVRGGSSASWRISGRAGANALSLKRRLPTGRTLAKGTYTLVATAGATTARARFRVR
jgi:thermitase